MHPLRLLVVMVAFVAMLGAHTAGAAEVPPVGRIQIASGEVQIISRDKQTRPAARGDLVYEGDTVITGKEGAAHIRMSDDGIIAMRPDTRIVIDTFRWEGKEDGTERSVLSLIRGGFRAITGVIGRTNKSQYIVNTTSATIGIRGTDHEPFHIPPPAAGEKPAGPPGTYNKVNVGETFIRSAAGTLELSANQIGFAPALPGVAPVRLERLPQFMRATALPRGKPDLRRVREFTTRDPRRAEMARELRQRGVSLRDLRRAFAFRMRTADEDFDLSGQSGGFRFAPSGVALSGSILFRESGSLGFNTGTVVAGSGDSILLNQANEPVIVSDASGFRYSRERGVVLDRGAATVDGTGVDWGLYAGGLRFTEAQGVSRTLLFSFAQAAQVTPPSMLLQPGAAFFATTVGHSTPINEDARLGGIARLRAGLVFGANPRIVSYDLRVFDANARRWDASLTAPQSLRSFARAAGGNNLAVTCTGACAPTGQGQARGLVIGPNRDGMISSYGLIAGPAFVTGSIVVKP